MRQNLFFVSQITRMAFFGNRFSQTYLRECKSFVAFLITTTSSAKDKQQANFWTKQIVHFLPTNHSLAIHHIHNNTRALYEEEEDLSTTSRSFVVGSFPKVTFISFYLDAAINKFRRAWITSDLDLMNNSSTRQHNTFLLFYRGTWKIFPYIELTCCLLEVERGPVGPSKQTPLLTG